MKSNFVFILPRDCLMILSSSLQATLLAMNDKTYELQPLEYYCTISLKLLTLEIRWQKATGNRFQEVGIWLNVIRE